MRTPQRQCQPATPGASPCRVWETPHPSAARVQPPDTCMTGSTGNAGGKPLPGACFSGSACAASDSVPGYLHGRVCKCRKRSNAGVPGAVAPGKIILESPPSPAGKGVGGIGATKKANGRGGRRPKRQASHANITATGQANTAKNKRHYGKQHAIHC